MKCLPDFPQRTQPPTKFIISYFRMHIELSIKFKVYGHLVYFLNLLNSNRSELGLSLNDIYDIIHSLDKTKKPSLLDYANQNKDKTAAMLILEYEKLVHCNDQSAIKRCIRENLVNEEIKVWMKDQCEEKKDIDGNNKHGHVRIIFTLLVESLIFSILPYLWDQVSDIRLYQTYRSMSNDSLFGNLTKPYSINTTIENGDNGSSAALITKWILIMNGLIYVLGSILCSPTWLQDWLNDLNIKITSLGERFDSTGKYTRDEVTEFRKEYLTNKKFFVLLLIPTARLLWPLLVLIPHQFINMVSNVPSKDSMAKYKSENIWLFIKVVESSVENVLQTALQIWLLIPIFGLISQWSVSELLLTGIKGAGNIMSFGLYKPDNLDIVIGKIMFTVILLSFSHSWMKLKKQGLGLLSKLKSLPVVFVSTILQVSSKIYVIRNLMIMEVPAVKKYTLFLLVHFLSLLVIKIAFETRKKKRRKNFGAIYTEKRLKKQLRSFRNILKFQKLQQALDFFIPTLNQISKAMSFMYYHIKRPVLLVTSCLSSTLVMVDLHWISSKLHYPKHNFISQCLFFLLLFVENLVMTLLPFLAPSLFPSTSEFNHDSFTIAIVFVNVSWIISVCLEVIIILI